MISRQHQLGSGLQRRDPTGRFQRLCGFINDNQMAVCARDVGTYLGLSIGALLYLVFPRRFSMWWLLVLIVPLGLDGTIQLLTSYESNNTMRMITGGLYGG